MLRFHNQMSTKACPGNSLDYQKIVAAVQALQASGEFAAAFGTRDVSDGPFGSDVVASRTVIESVSRPLPVRDDPADAEPDDDAMSGAQVRALFEGVSTAPAGHGARRDGARVTALPPEPPQRPASACHQSATGQFSTDGQYTTTPGDVDAIFDIYLPQAIEGARARKAPLRVVLYAHGGLVKESLGLQIASKHVTWWQKK